MSGICDLLTELYLFCYSIVLRHKVLVTVQIVVLSINLIILLSCRRYKMCCKEKQRASYTAIPNNEKLLRRLKRKASLTKISNGPQSSIMKQGRNKNNRQKGCVTLVTPSQEFVTAPENFRAQRSCSSSLDTTKDPDETLDEITWGFDTSPLASFHHIPEAELPKPAEESNKPSPKKKPTKAQRIPTKVHHRPGKRQAPKENTATPPRAQMKSFIADEKCPRPAPLKKQMSFRLRSPCRVMSPKRGSVHRQSTFLSGGANYPPTSPRKSSKCKTPPSKYRTPPSKRAAASVSRCSSIKKRRTKEPENTSSESEHQSTRPTLYKSTGSPEHQSTRPSLYKSTGSPEHQGNKSETSVVCKRDSWIWFSPETRPSVENFASRQRKFQSEDPRVAKLAAEIRRQDEMNRDIEREAESLIESSSLSNKIQITQWVQQPYRPGPHNCVKLRCRGRSRPFPYMRSCHTHQQHQPRGEAFRHSKSPVKKIIWSPNTNQVKVVREKPSPHCNVQLHYVKSPTLEILKIKSESEKDSSSETPTYLSLTYEDYEVSKKATFTSISAAQPPRISPMVPRHDCECLEKRDKSISPVRYNAPCAEKIYRPRSYRIYSPLYDNTTLLSSHDTSKASNPGSPEVKSKSKSENFTTEKFTQSVSYGNEGKLTSQDSFQVETSEQISESYLAEPTQMGSDIGRNNSVTRCLDFKQLGHSQMKNPTDDQRKMIRKTGFPYYKIAQPGVFATGESESESMQREQLTLERSLRQRLICKEVNTTVQKMLFDTEQSSSSLSPNSMNKPGASRRAAERRTLTAMTQDAREVFRRPSTCNQTADLDVAENDGTFELSAQQGGYTNKREPSFTSVQTAEQSLSPSASPKSKRTNIYNPDYYLGKRVCRKQQSRQSSVEEMYTGSVASRWKKTNPTWSRTFSKRPCTPKRLLVPPSAKHANVSFVFNPKNLPRMGLKELSNPTEIPEHQISVPRETTPLKVLDRRVLDIKRGVISPAAGVIELQKTPQGKNSEHAVVTPAPDHRTTPFPQPFPQEHVPTAPVETTITQDKGDEARVEPPQCHNREDASHRPVASKSDMTKDNGSLKILSVKLATGDVSPSESQKVVTYSDSFWARQFQVKKLRLQSGSSPTESAVSRSCSIDTIRSLLHTPTKVVHGSVSHVPITENVSMETNKSIISGSTNNSASNAPYRRPGPAKEETAQFFFVSEGNDGTRPDFSRHDFAKHDFAKPDFAKPDFAKPDCTRLDCAKADSTRLHFPFLETDHAQLTSKATQSNPEVHSAPYHTILNPENSKNQVHPSQLHAALDNKFQTNRCDRSPNIKLKEDKTTKSSDGFRSQDVHCCETDCAKETNSQHEREMNLHCVNKNSVTSLPEVSEVPSHFLLLPPTSSDEEDEDDDVMTYDSSDLLPVNKKTPLQEDLQSNFRLQARQNNSNPDSGYEESMSDKYHVNPTAVPIVACGIDSVIYESRNDTHDSEIDALEVPSFSLSSTSEEPQSDFTRVSSTSFGSGSNTDTIPSITDDFVSPEKSELPFFEKSLSTEKTISMTQISCQSNTTHCDSTTISLETEPEYSGCKSVDSTLRKAHTVRSRPSHVTYSTNSTCLRFSSAHNVTVKRKISRKKKSFRNKAKAKSSLLHLMEPLKPFTPGFSSQSSNIKTLTKQEFDSSHTSNSTHLLKDCLENYSAQRIPNLGSTEECSLSSSLEHILCSTSASTNISEIFHNAQAKLKPSLNSSCPDFEDESVIFQNVHAKLTPNLNSSCPDFEDESVIFHNAHAKLTPNLNSSCPDFEDESVIFHNALVKLTPSLNSSCPDFEDESVIFHNAQVKLTPSLNSSCPDLEDDESVTISSSACLDTSQAGTVPSSSLSLSHILGNSDDTFSCYSVTESSRDHRETQPSVKNSPSNILADQSSLYQGTKDIQQKEFHTVKSPHHKDFSADHTRLDRNQNISHGGKTIPGTPGRLSRNPSTELRHETNPAAKSDVKRELIPNRSVNFSELLKRF